MLGHVGFFGIGRDRYVFMLSLGSGFASHTGRFLANPSQSLAVTLQKAAAQKKRGDEGAHNAGLRFIVPLK